MPNSLKPFWNTNLDKLKEISIDLHNLWRSIGSPTNNSIINAARIKAKYQYKLAISQSKSQSMVDRANEINADLAERNFTSFWKCWNTFYNNKNNVNKTSIIDGKSDSNDIANTFREYYSKIYIKSSDDQHAVHEFNLLRSTTIDLPSKHCSIDVREIEDAIHLLKTKKSADHNGITSEHILNSHPSLVVHLKALFTFMMNHSYVPDSFTQGVIIPILKDKRGDLTDVQNYRPITLCPIISNFFEYYLLNKYATFLILMIYSLALKRN